MSSFKKVRPLLSTDYCEAHRRVIGLYKAVYRYIPWIADCTLIRHIRNQEPASRAHRLRAIFATKRENAGIGYGVARVAVPVKYHDIPKSEDQVRMKVRELFYKNACVTDLRVIDMLIIKGWMEFMEVKNQWQMKGRVFANWEPTIEPKPYGFLGRFIEGVD